MSDKSKDKGKEKERGKEPIPDTFDDYDLPRVEDGVPLGKTEAFATYGSPLKPKPPKKRFSLGVWLLAVVVPCYAADQLTKWLVCRTMLIGTGFNVIPGFFDIIHVRNTGAAFGMLQGIPDPIRTWFFLGVTVAAIIAILVMFIGIREKSWLLKLVFCLVVAGALGNLTDRFSHSEVVDFLSLYVGRFRWPAFNLADVYISLGMIGLIFHILTAPKEE